MEKKDSVAIPGWRRRIVYSCTWVEKRRIVWLYLDREKKDSLAVSGWREEG
jgi:hypothetical protein